jgi:hypothetical protein
MPKKEDYWRDPEKYRAKTLAYAEAHPEWKRETGRLWMREKRAADPAAARAADRRNREKMSSEQKAARAEYMRLWHLAHPGYTKEVQAKDHANFPSKRMVEAAKHRARKLGVPFDLDWREIAIPAVCPVLGIPLTFGTAGFQDASPSLDRLRPELGYIKGNVRVISYRANAIKRDASLDEMRLLVAYLERELG